MKENIVFARSVVEYFERLGIERDQIIFTGSFAAHLYGVANGFGDLDVIFLRLTQRQIERLEEEIEENDSYDKKTKLIISPCSITNETHTVGHIKFINQNIGKQIKIYLFLSRSTYESLDVICVNGLNCTRMPGIIEAKIGYGRKKDFDQLHAWSKNMFPDFEKVEDTNDLF